MTTIQWNQITWSVCIPTDNDPPCDIHYEMDPDNESGECSGIRWMGICQPSEPEAATYAASFCDKALEADAKIDGDPIIALVLVKPGLYAPNTSIYQE